MKTLNDIDWASLTHAYGSAADIPALLEQLKDFPPHEDDYRSEPYFSLWNALCHQGDVYSASYAALPFIVNLIEANPTGCHWSPLLLVASIEIARSKGDGPAIDKDLLHDYKSALAKLPVLVGQMAQQEWDELFTRVASATMAAAKGQPILADTILELEPDLIPDLLEWIHER